MTTRGPVGAWSGIERHPVPVSHALRAELPKFWSDIFHASFAELDDVLAGVEAAANVDTIWLARQGAAIVATCHLTVSRIDPRLGGLGEIATAPDFRGRGLAEALVERAVAEFSAVGGTRLVLGTVNPVAARLYEKFGFRYLPGTRVMLRTIEAADGFGSASLAGCDIEIVAGGPQHRLTIIPPILMAADNAILDANVGLLATRVAEQASCMGLYPRYHRVAESGGQWFVAQRPDGVTLGIASVTRLDGDVARMDAFVVAGAGGDALADLVGEATKWAASAGLTVEAVCHADDQHKQAVFSAQNFAGGETTSLTVAGRTFPVIRFRRL